MYLYHVVFNLLEERQCANEKYHFIDRQWSLLSLSVQSLVPSAMISFMSDVISFLHFRTVQTATIRCVQDNR